MTGGDLYDFCYNSSLVTTDCFIIDIGKAGHHLKLGAAIPYNTREIEVNIVVYMLGLDGD